MNSGATEILSFIWILEMHCGDGVFAVATEKQDGLLCMMRKNSDGEVLLTRLEHIFYQWEKRDKWHTQKENA